MIKDELDPEKTEQQGKGEKRVWRVAGMNHLKWPVPVCFHRLPERRQPAVHELHKVSQYSFIGFVKEGIAVYVHTFELLVALAIHLLLRADYGDSETGAT